MANNTKSIDLGGCIAEADVQPAMFKFIEGQTYPFIINIANKCNRSLVFPVVSPELINPGEEKSFVIKNEYTVNELFIDAEFIGRTHEVPVLITVSVAIPAKAASASDVAAPAASAPAANAPTDKGAAQ